jgi:hypothetical protein
LRQSLDGQLRHLRKHETFDASDLAVRLLIAVFLRAKIAPKLIDRTLLIRLPDRRNIRNVLRPSRCQFCGDEVLG